MDASKYNLTALQMQAVLLLCDPSVTPTRDEVATRIGVVPSTISNWMNTNLSFQRALNDVRGEILEEIKNKVKSQAVKLTEKAIAKLEDVMDNAKNLINGESRKACEFILTGSGLLNKSQVRVEQKKEVTITHRLDRDSAISVLKNLKNVRTLKLNEEKRIPYNRVN